MWRDRHANHLGETSGGTRHSQTEPGWLRHPCRAIHNSGDRRAWITGSVVGVLLSLALFFILGIGPVFFGKQLLDSWRRRHPPAGVARVGSDREHRRGLDVRSICKLFGCDRDAASGPRRVSY